MQASRTTNRRLYVKAACLSSISVMHTSSFNDNIASEYLSDSPFGSNYQLPLVGLHCSSSASNISECQISTQKEYCNHRRTVGIFCKGSTTVNTKYSYLHGYNIHIINGG